MTTPPPSPLRMTLTVSTTVANAFVKFKRARHDALDFASGIPITHPTLSGEDATCKRRVPLNHGDRFVCKDAVDVAKLLRGSRASLLEKAVYLGANVLVEERWVFLFFLVMLSHVGEWNPWFWTCGTRVVWWHRKSVAPTADNSCLFFFIVGFAKFVYQRTDRMASFGSMLVFSS